MDLVYAAIRADVTSNDIGRQSSALLVALQLAASEKDISSLSPTICSEIIGAAGNSVVKKLAYDCIRISRLTADEWETICRGMANDFSSTDPDVTAAGMAFVTALPSWRVGDFVSDHAKEISNCILHNHVHLRRAAVEALGCLLARDDMVTLCASSVNLLDRVNIWWRQIGQSTLDTADSVSSAAFEAIGRLFAEFSTKRLSRLAGDKLIPTESSLAVRSQFVMAMIEFVWSKRDLLMARSAILPLDFLRSTVYPLVYAAKAVTSGMVEDLKALIGNPNPNLATLHHRHLPENVTEEKDLVNAERILGVSDIVSFLVPYLSSSLDPALVFEVGIHILSLAGVPGGKPEWASAPITAFLTLWDRQEYAAGREAIVKAVVSNIQLLDLHMQVALFKRLLVMVRNLRVEADRMHALACICRTALIIDLFIKESARRGQKPWQGTDVSSLFEDASTREEFSSVTSDSLFREELLACLVESTFQLSQPLPHSKSQAPGAKVLGSLASGARYESMGWAQSALEVVEVCRPCIKWDCQGRTYAMDCYLRLLVQLCLLYDTAGGVKTIKDGATPEQVQAEQRLQALQRQLLDDLHEVSSPRMRVRLLWVLAEHLDLSQSTPLFADEPREPLNILISTIDQILFNVDPAISVQSNRLQDIEAILVCAQHLGSRNFRAAALVARELDDFRNSPLSDAVNKQHCRLILNILAHIHKFPENKWAARVGPTGEYPFTHHKLSVQYHEAAAAQDRKLENLVRTAVQDLWRPGPSELDLVTSGSNVRKQALPSQVMSGSSDPVLVEAFHLTDVSEHRVTLHMKVLNSTELELGRVDVQVGLIGALHFMDDAPRAVRQLRGLHSQEPVKADVTVTVSRFQRCALCIQLVYYVGTAGQPGAPTVDASSAVEYLDEIDDNGQVRARRKARPMAADPVVLRCKPYRVPLTEMLLPYEVSPVEFFRIVSGLPAMAEHTGKYLYETEEKNIVLSADEIGVRRLLAGLRGIEAKPLHKVCQHMLRSRAGFQVCYMAKTWYGDILSLVIFGISDISSDGGLGEEFTAMLCKFVLRSSAQHVLDEILAEPQEWLDDLTGGMVRMVTEDELKAELEEKQKKTAEHIVLLKQSMKASVDGVPMPTIGMEVEEELEPKLEALVIPEEQQALQAAVLQGWSALRAQQLAVQSQVRA